MDKETCHNLLMKIFDPTRPDPTTRTGGGNGNRSVPRERQTCGHTSKPMDQVTCLQALSVYRSQLRHPSLILVVPPIEKNRGGCVKHRMNLIVVTACTFGRSLFLGFTEVETRRSHRFFDGLDCLATMVMIFFIDDDQGHHVDCNR